MRSVLFCSLWRSLHDDPVGADWQRCLVLWQTLLAAAHFSR
ncbi:hypothetical protein [Phormidesmis sp. 146-33]